MDSPCQEKDGRSTEDMIERVKQIRQTTIDRRLDYKYERWITDQEGELLYNLTRLFSSQILLESGTANGYSTCWITAGLPEETEIHTFDVVDRKKVWDESILNLEDIKEKVNFHLCRFEDGIGEVITKRGDKKALIFIDGDHTYRGVRCDWEAVEPHLIPGDVIVFHDMNYHSIQKLFARLQIPKMSTSQFFEFDTKRGVGVVAYDIRR